MPYRRLAAQDYKPGHLLNWNHSRHWLSKPARCVHCRKNTFLRDEDGAPSHKVCAERVLLGLPIAA
jgi:hypothetical protein